MKDPFPSLNVGEFMLIFAIYLQTSVVNKQKIWKSTKKRTLWFLPYEPVPNCTALGAAITHTSDFLCLYCSVRLPSAIRNSRLALQLLLEKEKQD